MAKKFGKFLLLTAAVGSAAAAVYYYMQKKNSATDIPEDEDYDDFSDGPNEDNDSSRNYVSLNPEGKTDASAEATAEKKDTFTPLSEQVKKTEEAVEEFFDEDDPVEDSAPAGGN